MKVEGILDTLNIVSEKLFKSIEHQVYEVLDKIVDIGPKLLTEEPLKNIFFENKLNGIIIIANALILFYAVYYTFSILLSLYNGNKVQNVYNFIFKMIIITLVVNNSYYICEQILYFTELLTDSINIFAKELIGHEASFENLKEAILSINDFMKTDILSLDGVIKGMVSFGSVSILIHFAIRYVTIIFLIIISPLALVSLSSYITSGIFKSWGNLLFTNLIVQVIVKLVLIIPLTYKNVNTVMYKIILVGSIYILYKLNTFVKDLTARISTDKVISNIFKGG